MPAKKIKAVLFDLDGTLSHHEPRDKDVFVGYVASLGFHITEEDRIRAARWEHFYFARSPEIQEDVQTYGEDHKGFWLNFSKRRLIALGLTPAQADELAENVSSFMEENYKPRSFVPEDAFALLDYLQKAGYALGVVSNRRNLYLEDLQDLKLDSYFEFTLAGGEVNSFKPDGVIFEKGVKLAKSVADETMYVGDNYYADIVGARNAGLRPVLYDPIALFNDCDCETVKSFDELSKLLKTT